MPITQNRILALIDAARDYQQAWRKAVQFFAGQASAIQAGLTTHEQAWAQLAIIMQSHIALESPITTTETLARETEHFRTAFKKNIQSAKWQRTKRGLNPQAKEYGLDSTQQAKQKSKHFSNPIKQPGTGPEPETKPEPEPEIKMISESTDAQQVNADSDLFSEPELSPETRAKIDRELETQLAAEAYQDQYGQPAKEHGSLPELK